MILHKRFSLALRPKPPYSFSLTVRKPAGWNWGARNETFEENTLWSAGRWRGKIIGLRVSSKGKEANPRLDVSVFSDRAITPEEKPALADHITWSLGADDDISAFYALGKKDPLVRRLSKDLFGMHNAFWGDVFDSALLAVCLQMAPVKRSMEMMDAVIRNYGEDAVFDGKKVRLWPAPRRLARVTVGELKRKCKLGYRAKSIVRIARQLAAGFPDIDELRRMTPEAAKEKLLELYGVGDYSAQMITPHPSFALDVWSSRIFHKLLFGREPKDSRAAIPKVEAEAIRRWGEWRDYVFTYVLNDLKNLGFESGE